MSQKAKKELLRALRPTYEVAPLAEKSALLDGFLAATGYSRKYAIALLSGVERTRTRKLRARVYDDALKEALIKVWCAANKIASKRLVPFLPQYIESMEKFGHLNLDSELKARLLSVSPATVDRLLKSERNHLGKGISTTRPGNILRTQIPVRTFADWNDVRPGFFEADLVAHCGGDPRGEYLHTLTMTDIATGWTEPIALLCKREEHVLEAICNVTGDVPFRIVGLDTDNGGEFINHGLAQYCIRQEISFTRSRPYKKNDQAHVEEKNGSIVRRLIGYDRYQGEYAWGRMTELYRVARLYINYFQPSLKLKSKERLGARTRKVYDEAQTPCQRLLSYELGPSVRKKLERTLRTLDPVALLKKMELLQEELWKSCAGETQPQIAAEVKPMRHRKERKKPTAPKAVKSRLRGSWSKRKDPLADGPWEWACSRLKENPALGQRRLLAMLMAEFPNRVSRRQSTTLSSRIRGWREAHPEHAASFPHSVRPRLEKELNGVIKEYSLPV